MVVNVEEVVAMQKRRREINSIPLEEIEFFKEGKPCKLPPKEIIKEFKFTGLSNIDFIIEFLI